MINRDKLPYDAVTGKSFYDGEQFPIWYAPDIPNGVTIYEDIDCTFETKKPYENFRAYYIKYDLSHEYGLMVDDVKYPDETKVIEWIPTRNSVIQTYKKVIWNNNNLPSGVKIYDDKGGHREAIPPYLVGKPYYIRCSNLGNKGIEVDGVKIEDCSTSIEFIPSIHSEIRLYDFETWNGIFNETSGIIVKIFNYGDLVTEKQPPYLVGRKYVLEVNNTLSKDITIMIDKTFYTVPKTTTKYYDFIPFENLVISIDCEIPFRKNMGGGGYDVIVKTQKEFDDLTSSKNWRGVTSVLFVGDGGNLKFRVFSNNNLDIPNNVLRISGKNTPIITATGLWSKPLENWVMGYPNNSENAILRTMDNITVEGYSNSSRRYIYGFRGCYNMFNCKAIIRSTETQLYFHDARGFNDCQNLLKCSADIIIKNGVSTGFNWCRYVQHSTTTISNNSIQSNNECVGFNNSKEIDGCKLEITKTTNGFGFKNCRNISNSNCRIITSVGGAVVNNCNGITNITKTSDTNVPLYSGNNQNVN